MLLKCPASPHLQLGLHHLPDLHYSLPLLLLSMASVLFFECIKLVLSWDLCTYSFFCLNTFPQTSLSLSSSPPPNLCTNVTFSIRPVLTILFSQLIFILLNFSHLITPYLICSNIISSSSLSIRLSGSMMTEVFTTCSGVYSAELEYYLALKLCWRSE